MIPPEVASVTQLTGRWWVAHTKARFEKVLAFDLLERGVGYFLPLSHRVKISGQRKRHLMLPLFSSYVFFNGDDETRYGVISTGRVCQVIEVKDQRRMSRQLADLEKALRVSGRLDPYPTTAIGRKCRVIAGQFEGITGTVVSFGPKAKFVLEIGLLGQGASVEIDADLLEPVEDENLTHQKCV